MSVLAGKEMLLLAALDVHRTWHSVSWLAGRGLIPADWPAADAVRCLDGLAQAGWAARRYSETRRIPMYRITAEGMQRLGPAGHQDRVVQASEEPRYVDPPGPAEWEPPGRLICTSGSGFSRRGAP
ncbi:MAG TPA: hypothetical protein VGS06_20950 [Streptosporangiaceae bacterium]|nr:hypothetical protein [Streptosporangiaceae bacterium]